MFKVSQSKISTWRRCRYKYHLKYVENIRRRLKKRPMAIGSIIHDCLEEYLKTGSYAKSLKEHKKKMGDFFKEELAEEGLEDAIPISKQILEGYIDHWKKDGVKYLGVEVEVEVPLADGILLVGKLDAVVEKNGVFVFERKTCKKIPDESIRMSDLQSVIYGWALPRAINPKTGTKWPEPRGIIWDYVRNKTPTEPEVLKNGELTKRANLDSTVAVYVAAIEREGLDIDDYRPQIEALSGSERNFYRRITLPFSRQMREQVIGEFTQTAIMVSKLHGIVNDRNLTRDCTWCEFHTLCQARLRGLDTDFLMKREYEVRDEDEDSEEEVRVDSDAD